VRQHGQHLKGIQVPRFEGENLAIQALGLGPAASLLVLYRQLESL
jgi:hypothetical protein